MGKVSGDRVRGWCWVFVSSKRFLYSPLYFAAVAVWDNSITAKLFENF